MSKPKVALSITGHMRNYDVVFPHMKQNIIDQFDVDVYIHTYDTLGYSLNAGRCPESVGVYEIDGFDRTSPMVNENHVRELFNPKSMTVEKWDELEPMLKEQCSFIKRERYNRVSENPMNPWSMNRKVYLSWLDIESSGVKYDYIIRHRPDMFIDTPALPTNDQLFIPLEFGYRDFNVLCDTFAIGRTEPMKKYMTMWTKIQENYEATQTEWEQTNSWRVQWNGHVFMEYHLRKENVEFDCMLMGYHK